jgi:hypothetical protein
MEEITGEWRKLHSEELFNLNLTLNIIKEIMSRRIRRVRLVKPTR